MASVDPTSTRPAGSAAILFAFTGGSDLGKGDHLHVAMARPEGSRELRIATLMTHAEVDQSTVAVTCLHNQRGKGYTCDWHSEHVSQAEAIERFTNAIPGVMISEAPPREEDLVRYIGSLPAPPSRGICGVVCPDVLYATGPKVWPAAVAVCNRLMGPLASRTRGRRVLELGCGLGLPGIAALQCGAEYVLLTDCGDDVGSVLTAALNSVFQGWRAAGRLNYLELSWGASAAGAFVEEHGSFDLILCCDCVYEPFFGVESWQLLAETIETLLTAPNDTSARAPVAILSVERRIEGCDGVDDFLEALAGHGLDVQSEEHDPDASPTWDQGDVEVLIVTRAQRPSRGSSTT